MRDRWWLAWVTMGACRDYTGILAVTTERGNLGELVHTISTRIILGNAIRIGLTPG